MIASLKTRAYRHIRRSLMGGELSTDTFMSPAQLAKTIGVSDTPVREAIIQLESEGLVERVPKLGIRARKLDRHEFQEMLELRVSLESTAARLAAKRITAVQLAKLRENRQLHLQSIKELRQSEAAVVGVIHDRRWPEVPGERLAKLNALFHLTILSACGNRKLIKIVTDLHLLSKALRGRVFLSDRSPISLLARDYHFHRRVLRALETGNDRYAGQWMEQHVTDAMNYHLATYDWLHRQDRNVLPDTQEWSDDILDTIDQMESDLANETGTPSVGGDTCV